MSLDKILKSSSDKALFRLDEKRHKKNIRDIYLCPITWAIFILGMILHLLNLPFLGGEEVISKGVSYLLTMMSCLMFVGSFISADLRRREYWAVMDYLMLKKIWSTTSLGVGHLFLTYGSLRSHRDMLHLVLSTIRIPPDNNDMKMLFSKYETLEKTVKYYPWDKQWWVKTFTCTVP